MFVFFISLFYNVLNTLHSTIVQWLKGSQSPFFVD